MSLLKLAFAFSLAVSSYGAPNFYDYAEVDDVVARLDPPMSSADCVKGAAGAIGDGETLSISPSQNSIFYICAKFGTLSNKQTLYVRGEGVDSGYIKDSEAFPITGSFYDKYHSTYISVSKLAEEGEDVILSGIIRRTQGGAEHKRKDVRITYVNEDYASNNGDDIGTIGSVTVTRQSNGEEVEANEPFGVDVADNEELDVRVVFENVKAGNKLSIVATPTGSSSSNQPDAWEFVSETPESAYIKHHIVQLNQYIGASSIEIEISISEGDEEEALIGSYEPIWAAA